MPLIPQELTDGPPRRVVGVEDRFRFVVDGAPPTSPLSAPGGYVTQVKQPAVATFEPLDSSLAEPLFVPTDFLKEARLPATHALWRGLHAFRAARGRYPAPWDAAEAGEAVAFAEGEACGSGAFAPAGAAAEFGCPLPRSDAVRLASAASAVLSPVCSVVGAMAASEALKAVSGKFMPVRQWMHFELSEALPAEGTVRPADCAPLGDRYDGQRAAVGSAVQDRLCRASLFVVGAGAIGCEALKTLAMMGVAAPLGAAAGAASASSSSSAVSGPRVTVTDMDSIETSNLSRQFLFRPADVGRPKSSVAAAAARAMNPHMRVAARETRVGADTEDVFGEPFWSGLDGVVTALDNVQARLYVDQRCVRFRRPMLDSGTLGTKGSTQCVLPHQTVSYGSTRDPEGGDIPACTLKDFPYKIEHTLQWARDWFEGELKHSAEAAGAYTRDPAFLASLADDPNRAVTVARVASALGMTGARPPTPEACAAWARAEFERMFRTRILQLRHSFPADAATKDGSAFWSGTKRRPSALAFDPADPLHREFVVAAARLRGAMLGVDVPAAADDDADALVAAAGAAEVDAFVPSDAAIPTNDEELAAARKAEAAGASAEAADAADALPPREAVAGRAFSPIEFDKDEDLHAQLVTAASNLRARNYAIGELDLLQSRRIAGRIIPAIATTTALVVGLVGIELLKLAQTWAATDGGPGVSAAPKPLSDHREAFVNLALPLVTLSEPVACPRTVLRLPAGAAFVPPAASGAAPGAPREWAVTMWDTIELQGPMTLQVSAALTPRARCGRPAPFVPVAHTAPFRPHATTPGPPQALQSWASEQFGLELDGVSVGSRQLYNGMMAAMPSAAARMKRRATMT